MLLIGLIIVVLFMLFLYMYGKQTKKARRPEQLVIERPAVEPVAPKITTSVDWTTEMMNRELEPEVIQNHNNFVESVRRFSSGANFTSIEGDDQSDMFTNFIGLQRPQHVRVGDDSRQQPDIDEDVLKQNKTIRWNS
jgi:hypothetical protein